jgi:predicted transcriptional regulator
MMVKPTSVRLDADLTEQLDTLAATTDRPRSWHIERAVRLYVADELAFIEAVERGKAQARAGLGRTLDAVSADLERMIAERRASR